MTGSTVPEMHVEICSNCHPLYTGKTKLVDVGGRVERFRKIVAQKVETSKVRRGKKVKIEKRRAQRLAAKEEKTREEASAPPHALTQPSKKSV